MKLAENPYWTWMSIADSDLSQNGGCLHIERIRKTTSWARGSWADIPDNEQWGKTTIWSDCTLFLLFIDE